MSDPSHLSGANQAPSAESRGEPELDAQTARLAALGFMVAGVCHEVSNPLTAIHSMVQLLQSGSLPPETVERGLANIATNVQRVLAITRKLNDFSRASVDARRAVAVDAPLLEAVQIVSQDALFRAIDVEHVRSPELSVTGVHEQLAQVYVNVLMNAAQAMEGRGRIVIESRRLNSTAEVSIRDTGPGIAPGHLPRLFEPFFTTKPTGEGTGLGLAISNEIVIEHGGAIHAHNHADGGACFKILLPLHDPEADKR